MNVEYIRPVEASEYLKVTTRTLEKWADAGKLDFIRTGGGHRRYLKSNILSLSNGTTDNRESICYCRVSTSGQKKDLETQIEFFRLQYPNHRIISDIGSGINFKRKGINSILELAFRSNLKEVVVTHKDRLCRFGFELIERIVESTNGRIVVLNSEETTPEKELVNDLLSIITVFSSRLYGLRSHKIRKQIREATENTQNSIVSEQE